MNLRLFIAIACILISLSIQAQPYSFSQLSTSNGLSHNQINCILKDSKGFLWFGTLSGLNRYDGYTFKTFKHKEGDSTSLINDEIITIQQAPHNKLLIETANGQTIFDPATEKFSNAHELPGLPAAPITRIIKDKQNNFWLAQKGYGISKYKISAQRISNEKNVTDLACDENNNMWGIEQNGTLYKNNQKVYTFTTGTAKYRLFADTDNDLWIYTDGNPQGIFRYTPATNKVQHYNKETGLSTNLVTGIQQDNKGRIWISTDHGGINIINKQTGDIQYLQNNPADNKTIAQNSINAIYRDNTGIIWLGTYKKGVSYYHERIIKFPLYKHDVDVNRFVEDANGNWWIGTNGAGLIYYNRSNNTWQTFKHKPGNSISNDVIVSLCIDHEQKLWIGSYYGGLDSYDGKNFTHYKYNPADTNSLSDNRVWEIYEDAQQQLWIGTLSGGLNRFDKQKKIFHHYKQGPNYISALAEDSNGNLWIGTENGISILNRQTGRFSNRSLGNNYINAILRDGKGNMWAATRNGLHASNAHFQQSDGLPDDNVLTIMEDDQHHLWLSTANGICRFNPQLRQFKNYDERDGLQGRAFNENAAMKTSKDELLFGGANGFNIINPAAITHDTSVPQVVLTGFRLFDKEVYAGDEISLKYQQNIFSIEFAALNYVNPERSQYAYMLEGFNKECLTTNSTHRKVTYTNLDPGKYIFRVKASNGDGIWNEQGATLTITILPPFWKTLPAYIIYALMIIITLLVARRITIARANRRFQLAQQQQLDALKLKFFTNVSHEFRTPLSLIMAPIEKMMKQSPAPEQKKQYQLIYRNARRLLALVNQLLDFRKLEMQELRLHPAIGDIIPFIKDVTCSFADIAVMKNIRFEVHTEIDSLQLSFDSDKLERILFNLLSNAFKFTQEGGNVQVMVTKESSNVCINVKDSGIGIPLADQEKIFERFFQHDHVFNQGSGIGLAISKEFVRLHQGTITVDSEPGKGSCFTVLLPIHARIITEKPVIASIQNNKPIILIADDNEDIRFYLKDNLRKNYMVYEAVNGADAWEKVQRYKPDLVISDVMMPVMDGIELCRKIKQYAAHIPVILLTARTAIEPKLEGYETGANDYVTKPFSIELLQSRIKNLLAHPKPLIQPSNITVPSADDRLVQQCLQIVEQNISNPEFSVEDLSRALHMSRVALYKKLTAITGQSPLDFIRTIRLKRATQLLAQKQFTIAEIAYEVGFNDPKYFTRMFKKEFGVLPSEYAGK